MNFSKLIHIAARSIVRTKMRSALTMLGIIIGVGAVICMVAIGQGAQERIEQSILELGVNMVVITPGTSTTGGIYRSDDFGATWSKITGPTVNSEMHDLLTEQPAIAPQVEKEITLEYMREQYLRAAAIVQTDVNAETWRAFQLTVVDGKSCDEAAMLLGKPVGSVYAARSRIMRRLRDQVQRLEQDEL